MIFPDLLHSVTTQIAPEKDKIIHLDAGVFSVFPQILHSESTTITPEKGKEEHYSWGSVVLSAPVIS